MLKKKIIIIGILFSIYPIYTIDTTTKQFDEELFIWSRTFAELMHLVNTSYYVNITPEQAMIRAMNAFVSFDPHSKFLSPKEYHALKEVTSGQFCGIGVMLLPKEAAASGITVSDCIPQGPAQIFGIKPHDTIIALDDAPLIGLTTDEVAEKIKGPQNSMVKVALIRKGKPHTVTVKRNIIKDHDAFAYTITDHNCTYISIRTFTNTSARQLEKAVTHALAKNHTGIIIDIRNNSGGLLQAAVDCAALFLPKNTTVVYTKNREQKIIETFNTNREPLAIGSLPIFILVNHHTASAAEIFAGALKKNKSVYSFLLGTQTFGKGSVQPIFPLSNGCAVKLTSALYYLGNGTTIQAVGITPDFVIPDKITPETDTHIVQEITDNESKLAHAIKPELLKKTKKVHKKELSWQEKQKKSVYTDHYVQVALSFTELITQARTNKNITLDTPSKTLSFLFQHNPFTEGIDLEEINLE